MSTIWPRLLQRYRLVNGLKQDALARDFGVSQSTVSRWERGDRAPPERVRKEILATLPLTVELTYALPRFVTLLPGSVIVITEEGATVATSRTGAEIDAMRVRSIWRAATAAGLFMGDRPRLSYEATWADRVVSIDTVAFLMPDGHVLVTAIVHESTALEDITP